MKSNPVQQISPLSPIPQNLKLDKNDAILKIEVIKVGKSNNRRYLAVHNKGIVIYKVITIINIKRQPYMISHIDFSHLILNISSK